MNLENLKLEIPYQWRLGNLIPSQKSSTGFYSTCLAYIDARDAMDLLDFVVGQENWKDEYQYIGNQWLCGASICTKNGEWVTKWDTGTSGNFEAEKSIISDSFKRAWVKWGVGRFLYGMETELVEVVTFKGGDGKDRVKHAIDPTGKRIYDLSEHINSKQKHKQRIEKAREKLRAVKKEG